MKTKLMFMKDIHVLIYIYIYIYNTPKQIKI